jgi:redox-sensitive bicupin YhaK (pirin superfamily)
MKFDIHHSDTRGHANHGWLNAYHSFSFASWYNKDRVNFGALRVLNDDTVAPSMGFSMHPHDNMEIITIPLQGQIKHQDSMGHSAVIEAGEIQVMSAGTGIYHSEINPNREVPLKLFQIWIFPNKRGVEPRYDQRKIDLDSVKNDWKQLVSPNENDEGSWIHQEAWISMGEFEENLTIKINSRSSKHGTYLLVIEGEIEFEGERLRFRDALAIEDFDNFEIKALSKSKLLLLEVPMEF